MEENCAALTFYNLSRIVFDHNTILIKIIFPFIFSNMVILALLFFANLL